MSQIPNSTEIKNTITDLYESQPEAVWEARYQSLQEFDDENLSMYLTLAVSEELENTISYKKGWGIELTPYESVFDNCWIHLSEREDIARDLINDIHSDSDIFSSTQDIEYSNIRFWDCIVPYPDRRSSAPEDSFSSNKIINSPLIFSNELEQSASLLDASSLSSESQDTLESDLDIDSQRLEASGLEINKEHGRNRIAYIHQNHLINPFVNTFISGGNVNGRDYANNIWVNGAFDASHPLYISSDNSEQERTILPWTEIRPGIYKKILLQEYSYNASWDPKQSVWATSYYAILYNHDITPPLQENTFFAHDTWGEDIFVLPENAWFNSEKYGYFLCSDIESWCSCSSDNSECFVRDGRVFSFPELIEHDSGFSLEMKNNAGSGSTFVSDSWDTLQYDFETPDIRIFENGSQVTLDREYIRNAGVKYDGEEIRGKRFYNIENTFEYEADETLDIDFEIFDIDISDITQAKSGIWNYDITISEFSDASWNILGNLSGTWAEQVSLADLNTAIADTDIMTHAGRYQFMIEIEDIAGNQARIIWYYRILPAPIDTDMSVISTPNRDTLYADNSQTYDYTLTLMDEFGNPITWRELTSIEQDCGSLTDCDSIFTDMSWSTPAWTEALSAATFESISWSGGEIGFSLISLAPWVFTERFKVEFQNPGETLYFSAEENSFLKPFVWILETYVDWQWWLDDTLIVWSQEDYRLTIDDTTWLWESWSINNFSSYIDGKHPDTWFSLSWSLSPETDGIYFSGTFTSSLPEEEWHKEILEIENIGKSPISIEYSLSGETISYYLSSNEYNEIPPIRLSNTLSSPVYIQWLLQWVWNAHNPEEQQNITDIDTAFQRSIIRKNIAKHILSRDSWGVIQGVKYIDKTDDLNKNYEIESDPSNYQTLVVRNGNIHITNDFNAAQKNIGIISYKDSGYNVSNWYNEVGNIYIEPNVSEIHALMYADGALVSTESGTPVSSTLSAREYSLWNQLKIHGSIFTRNTLAGAEESGWDYMLPWGEQSSDRDLAIQYDLYYLRRGNTGCSQDWYWFCDIPQYLIIEYDTRIQSDPPPLFSQ